MDGLSSPISPGSFALPLSSPGELKVPGKDASESEVAAVAEKLEGVFFSMFVKEMRKTMTDGSMFGEGPEAETYEGFFDQMMGESLGKSGGLGIADMVMKNAKLNQERMKIEEIQASLAGAQEVKEADTTVDAKKGAEDVRESNQESV